MSLVGMSSENQIRLFPIIPDISRLMVHYNDRQLPCFCRQREIFPLIPLPANGIGIPPARQHKTAVYDNRLIPQHMNACF